MPQSHARVIVHLVFSTKNREPFIPSEHFERMFQYLGGALNALGCHSIRVGGVQDHVHLLFGMTRTLAISKVVEEVKKESSKWAKTTIHENFYWQNGYGVFSVGPSNVDRVVAYIDNQVEHHKSQTYQDEYRDLLRRHEVEWDERYVWD